MTEKKEISTKQFLSEFEKIIAKRGFAGAAKYFDVNTDFIRKVQKGNALPGPKILKKMKYEPLKTIKYRYKEV